jgi:patatin-like phospholipase/acyl hydrolase
MADIVRLYREEGKKIFPGTADRLWSRFARTFTQGPSAPKFSDSGLTEVLRSQFKNVALKDVEKPVLLITTYNTLTREAIVFKSYKVKAAYANIPLWEIVKASCSAPTYFPAHVLKIDGRDAPLIDGGVVANNPTACAVAEGMRINDKDANPDPCTIEEFAVVSVGTGQLTRPISIADALEWGAVEWAVPVIDVLFDGAADATDYVVAHMVPTGRYVRLQAVLDRAYDDMDNAGETNLNALLSVADQYIDGPEGQKSLAAIVKLIT